MSYQHVKPFIILCFLLTFASYCQEDHLIVHLALAAQNAPTNTIVTSVVKNATGVKNKIGISWIDSAYLVAKAWTLASWGEEIAKETYGIGNVVEKLIQRIQTDLNVPLSDGALRDIVNEAVIPVPDMDVVQKLYRLRECHPLYAVSNQDELEHDVFCTKMRDRHQVNLQSLFNQTFVVPAATCDPAISQAQEFLKRPCMIIDSRDELLRLSYSTSS